MVLGAILSAVFGAIIGYVAGWVIQLFPNFDHSLTGGLLMLTGMDFTGNTQMLLTVIGFLLGLLAGVIQILGKSGKK